MKFRLIEDQRDVWPVRVICDALSVSPSGYYAWRSRPESPREIANRELLSDIRRVHAEHRGRYGGRVSTPNYVPRARLSAASGSSG
jgi:putative transposase